MRLQASDLSLLCVFFLHSVLQRGWNAKRVTAALLSAVSRSCEMRSALFFFCPTLPRILKFLPSYVWGWSRKHSSLLCISFFYVSLLLNVSHFLFFSPLSYVLLKISIHPARYISYPAFGLNAYVCLKQPLCLLHPLLNTHTPDIQSHAHSCNPWQPFVWAA